MSIPIMCLNPPTSAGDVGAVADELGKYGIAIGYGQRYGYFIFIEPRLLCKMQKLMFIGWVAKPNRRAL